MAGPAYTRLVSPTSGDLQRYIAVVATEDDDRQAGPLAVRRGAQAPLDTDGIKNGVQTSREQLLDEH
jgi:hypothetical protein